MSVDNVLGRHDRPSKVVDKPLVGVGFRGVRLSRPKGPKDRSLEAAGACICGLGAEPEVPSGVFIGPTRRWADRDLPAPDQAPPRERPGSECWRAVDNFVRFGGEPSNSLITPYRPGRWASYSRSCPEGPTDRDFEEAGACIGGLGAAGEWFLRAFRCARNGWQRGADATDGPPGSAGTQQACGSRGRGPPGRRGGCGSAASGHGRPP